MKGYWLKIALGALGIFALGMFLVSAGRRGVDKAREAIVNSSLRITPADGPFTVDGHRLGRLTGVEILPGENQGIPRVQLAVKLDEGQSPVQLEHCSLVVGSDNQDSAGPQNGLRCLDPSQVQAADLAELGIVRLEQTDQSIQLLIPRAALERQQWLSHLPGRTSARGLIGSRGAGLHLEADSLGAFMMIRDQHGKPVFQLSADSTGAFIQVQDSNGKQVLHFRADSNGVKGDINAN